MMIFVFFSHLYALFPHQMDDKGGVNRLQQQFSHLKQNDTEEALLKGLYQTKMTDDTNMPEFSNFRTWDADLLFISVPCPRTTNAEFVQQT